MNLQLVEHVLGTAELVDNEEYVADVHVDATLKSGIELQVGGEALDIAVEG